MITLSPSRTSSVGPGIWPLYANTSLITPGRSGNRAGAAVMLTSTICGRDERLRRVRGDAKAPLVGLTSARFNWICLPGTVATPKDDSQPSASSAAAAWQQYTLRRISAMVSRSTPVRPDVNQPAPKKKSPDPADRTYVVPHTDRGASPAMPGAARKKPLLQPQRILSGWWRHNRRSTSGLQRLPP